MIFIILYILTRFIITNLHNMCNKIEIFTKNLTFLINNQN